MNRSFSFPIELVLNKPSSIKSFDLFSKGCRQLSPQHILPPLSGLQRFVQQGKQAVPHDSTQHVHDHIVDVRGTSGEILQHLDQHRDAESRQKRFPTGAQTRKDHWQDVYKRQQYARRKLDVATREGGVD